MAKLRHRPGHMRHDDHWKAQPRDPGGHGGGQWVKNPASAVVSAVEDVAKKAASAGVAPETNIHQIQRAAGIPSPRDTAVSRIIGAAGQRLRAGESHASVARFLRREAASHAQLRAEMHGEDTPEINQNRVGERVLRQLADAVEAVGRGKQPKVDDVPPPPRIEGLHQTLVKLARNPEISAGNLVDDLSDEDLDALARYHAMRQGADQGYRKLGDDIAAELARRGRTSHEAPVDKAQGQDDPRSEYAALKVTELKELLGKAGLPKTGRKADLVDRLVEHAKRPAGSSDPRAKFAAMKVAELKELLGRAGLPKTGRKADLVDRLVEHEKNPAAPSVPNEAVRPRPQPTKATVDLAKLGSTEKSTKVGAGEPVRPHNPAALGEVPSGRVRPDERPGEGELLHRPGEPDRVPDRRPSGRPGAAGASGPAVSGTAGADGRDKAGGGVGGAGGDAAAGGGGRDRRVDAQVFRPRGQADLAPATEKARLAANLAALRTLRAIQREERPATAQEQATLAKWSSWGALPNVFREPPPDRAYADAQAELKDLLSPAEYSAARRTVRNAHYTDAGYVSAIWDAMRKLGFHGGEVLEPGSGSGNFMGLAPEHAHVTGVELDPITAAISRALYPQHDVRTESFAETKTRDGAFDAVVGNVPFANTKLVDPEYNPGRAHNMHNHFIIKSLRMTKPGGMVAVLTSRYTMDSVRPDARKDMAELGDLVGAVRLPSGAHRKAAGTEVVTDLLLFRRREPGQEYAGLPFENTRTVQVDGKDIAINEMFVDHPDMVLGKLGAVHGMRGENDLVVKGDANAELALRVALDRIAVQARAKGLTQTEGQQPRPTFATTGRASLPDGHLRAGPDGTFTRLVGGVPQPYTPPAKQAEELRQLLHLRDTALALVDAESSSDDDTDQMKRLREELNRSYDSYTAEYGPVSRFTETRRPGSGDADVEEETVTRRRPPQGGFRTDPFSSVVRSLEVYDPVTGQARKTDIFQRRSIAPRTPRLTADTPADALAVSLDQNGEVDLSHIADLLGADDEAAAREALGTLVFDDPGTGRVLPAADYLSGNVREKLNAAREKAAEDPAYAPNVEALRRVLPADLTPAEIRVKLGSAWVEPQYVQQFLRETLRDPTLTVRRRHGTDWEVKSDRKRSRAAITEWGIRERSAVDLAEDLLSQRPVRVVVDGTPDRAKTEAAQAKAGELADRFEQWAWEDSTRAKELQDTYNQRFNSLVLRSYPGGDMELPGLAREGFYPYPHRFAAIRRIVNEPSVGLWHEVGAGKTSVMIASAMELRRLGMVNKPAIVVPNHMLDQMTREFLERYPQARVLGIGADELKNDTSGEKRRDIIARAATGNWDAVIITQGAFKRIPVSADIEQGYLQAELEPLRRSVERARAEVEQAKAAVETAVDKRAAETVANGKEKTVKEIEGMVQDAEERIKEHMTSVARDPGLSFERTGIDYLFVDEAHTYKNLRTPSRVQGMGIPGSQIATDLHMKLHYLRSKSDRVATLATATPIANSVSEAYTMLRYLRPDLLRDMRIESFDEFAANFGEVVSRMEVSPTGGLRQHSRFAKFVNLPELLKPWLVASDVKTAEDLRDIVKVPNLVERVDADGRRIRTPETVVVAPSEELKGFIGELVVRAGSIPYPPQKGADNMLKITGEGRAAALDLQMVGRRTDEPGKLDIAADRIAGIYNENKDRVYTNRDGKPVGEPGALQLVFSDIGTPSGKSKPKPKMDGEESTEDEASTGLAKFNAYEALRDKLVAQGIPKSKIRFIHDAKTDVEKAELFAAARDGRVAVLVGSTQKMGVGTNVQDRAIALHHLDAPWRPADVQQREGRIVRQGNKNPEVQVIRYVTEQSFDSYIWQAIATKAEFINQIMRGRADVREMDDVGDFALSATEVTALGTGGRHLIEHSEARAALTRLERGLRNHEADQRNLARQITDAQTDIAGSERTVAEIDQALAKRTVVTGDAFHMTLGGQGYTDRPEAQDRLRALLRRTGRNLDETDSTIGEFGGFPVRATTTDYGVQVELAGVPGSQITLGRAEIDSGDVITKLTNGLNNLERNRVRNVARMEQSRQDIAALQARVGRPFRDAEALQAARSRFDQVDAKLKAELAERGQTLAPTGPAEQAAARQAAALVDLRGRLDRGEGFAGIGEVTQWLEADPELAKEIPSDAPAKWGHLSPGGQLLVHKDTLGGGWQISIPRTMSGVRAMGDIRTRADALQLAEALERAGIPWNTDANLKEWRAPDGATLGEVVARIRSEHPALDKNGVWKAAAQRAEITRHTPERFREPLLEGRNRYDDLGHVVFARVPSKQRDEILAILQDADPDSDMATAVRLREYGLTQDDHYAQKFALAAAQRLERDYRAKNPQPLDNVRKRFTVDFERIKHQTREKARIDQLLAEADATGDFNAAAGKLRALADELVAAAKQQSWGSYSTQQVVDVAQNLAGVLEAKAEQASPFDGWSDSELRALLSQHGLETYGDTATLLARLRAAGVTVTIPETPEIPQLAASGRGAQPAWTRSAAAMAVFIVDILTGGRYTTQQRQARQEWIRAAGRAAGMDTHPGGEELHHYWTKEPEGLAQWAALPSGRWTALYGHLVQHMSPAKARRVASAWFLEVMGYAAGSDENRVASGKPPRGEKVGPG